MQNNPGCSSVRNEEYQQLGRWNNTDQPYPEDLCVHRLVSRQAETTPEALAVAGCSATLTYSELERRSNRLAHHLLALGVGPDVLVGLCVDRSPMMAVGALAILKAGGAYVPLDPSYPQERIGFILEDAGPQVVITQANMRQRLVAEGRQVVVLDPEPQEIAAQPCSIPSDLGNSDSLAYVIYTSGSTGQPKGVQITHRCLLNLIFWHQRAFAIEPTDRATQLASPGFDAAVWELWPYLTAGASLHFVADFVRAEPERLRDWLVKQEISISFVPTPLAERMLHLEWPTKTALRVLLTGADVLHHYAPANLPFVLVNNYGPTECTVVATSGPVSSDGRGDQLPPIGRPIANTRIYILDNGMHPVPIGSAGELHIAGAGLARGYLNRPDLTSEKFVSNPFSDIPGDRLYKTGDLARFLPDGQIEFLGRVDDQVKIRGYRIELNEIIGVLSRHPAVQENTVVASEDGAGDKRLVAYIVARTSPFPTIIELRNFLAKELPEYMLPAAFVRLDALPIGPNGKVDRSALPAPDLHNALRDETFVEPGTPTEQRIATMVAKLLGLERVGINDNFFLLGGNSLMGTQVIARVRNSFDVDLTLLSLFDHPTVAGIAAEVEQLIAAKLETMSEEEAQRLVDLSEQRASL
jgi:amino acid adenylation domain-containing protein